MFCKRIKIKRTNETCYVFRTALNINNKLVNIFLFKAPCSISYFNELVLETIKSFFIFEDIEWKTSLYVAIINNNTYIHNSRIL